MVQRYVEYSECGRKMLSIGVKAPCVTAQLSNHHPLHNNYTPHCTNVLPRNKYRSGPRQACVFSNYTSDEPLYALAHVDDLVTAGSSDAHAKLRRILRHNLFGAGAGALAFDGSKVVFLVRRRVCCSGEIHTESSPGCCEEGLRGPSTNDRCRIRPSRRDLSYASA